jgi:Rad3-related DNA helicase
VDEAHNLVDRAREMFSADLDGREILEVRRALKQAAPRCAKALANAFGDAETWRPHRRFRRTG